MISLIKQVQCQYKSSSVHLTWHLRKQKRKRKKNQTIFKLFGENYTNKVSEDWFKFKINITYEYLCSCTKCTKGKIVNQFNDAYERWSKWKESHRKDSSNNYFKLKPTQHKL